MAMCSVESTFLFPLRAFGAFAVKFLFMLLWVKFNLQGGELY
jgi:hypothetical protein